MFMVIGTMNINYMIVLFYQLINDSENLTSVWLKING